jgi:uncharacterized protein YabN with tetrapyrrole methylase and pyrophosphatase domain
MSGSITIIGLGPANPNLITCEVKQILERSQNEQRFYGLAHARSIAQEVCPSIRIQSLDYLYQLKDVDRPSAYSDLASMLIRKATEEGLQVVYLVAGSPLFYNDAVRLIRLRCASQKFPVRLVHGISFLEVVLQRVDWTGHHGLQLYSAWNVAHDDVVLAKHAPALLCQLGEFTSGGEAIKHEGSVVMLSMLKEKLLTHYPQDHPIVILHSSGSPHYESLATEMLLRELDRQPIPVYSNLWIPSLDAPYEAKVLP